MIHPPALWQANRIFATGSALGWVTGAAVFVLFLFRLCLYGICLISVSIQTWFLSQVCPVEYGRHFVIVLVKSDKYTWTMSINKTNIDNTLFSILLQRCYIQALLSPVLLFGPVWDKCGQRHWGQGQSSTWRVNHVIALDWPEQAWWICLFQWNE